MKKTWSSSLCAVSLAGALLCGCGEKEEIVPDMQKKEPAPAVTKTEAAPAPADEPELVPIQSLSQGNAQKDEKAEPAKEAPAVTGNIQPQEDGQFVIQVSIQPSKKGADAIVKKLAEQKIEAYVAEVENPGELEGTYYRVRIGYFATFANAQEYGKQVLSALNFQWWVDNSRNDEVGNPAGDSDNGGESSSYYAPPQDNQPEPAPAPEPEPAPAPAPAPEPEPAPEPAPAPAPEPEPAPAPAPEPAPAPAPAPEPAPAPAPAPAAPPAPPAEDFVDDWE